MGRGLLAGLVVVCPVIFSASAQAAPPVIVNSPNADWAETGASEDDGNRFVSVTFVARHDEGRRITQVVTSSGTFGVTSQYLGTAGNSAGTNRMASSVVRFTYSPPAPTSFTCTFFGGVRRVDETLAFSVRDDLGQQSASVSQSWRVIEDDQCFGVDDFPTLESVGQSASSANAGQNVLFSFACDDADETGTNDRCDFISWRKRRLNDGSVSGETQADAEDNVARSFSTSFATRGVWVVEARLCSEDSCQDASWWRIGTVAVNDLPGPTLDLTISGAAVVSGAGGYSVNQGDAANAVATVSDSGSQGAGQAIAWSSGRFDYAIPQLSGGTVVQSLTSAQRTHAIDTSTSGVKSISASVFDNGAIDGADFERRQSFTGSASIRVNARPTASDISTTTPEDTAKAIMLQGADADSQPAPLTYEIVGQPANGSVSLSGDTATFTPAAGFHGTTSFTYRAKDGPVSDAAWSDSNTATVTVTVTPVNDPPILGSIGDKTVDEGQELQFTISATDPDGDPLAYSASNLPLGASFSAATQTFTWTPGFDQAGSYPNVHFEVSDGALTDSEDITITVGNTPTECDDGIDNDGDGKVDHPADPQCESSADRSERPQCADERDNDGDGDIDYLADPGCSSARDNSESPNPQCSNGADDDSDGASDMADPGCSSPRDNNETNAACADTLDNDSDGKIDYPEDPGCSSVRDNGESPDLQCGDGLDNDSDERTDYPADPGCGSRTDNSESPDPQCSDFLDNDEDSLIDYPRDPGCRSLRDNSENSDSPPAGT